MEKRGRSFLVNVLTICLVFLVLMIAIILFSDDRIENTENIVMINESTLNSLEEDSSELKEIKEKNQELKSMDRIDYNPEFEEVERIVEESDADKYEHQEGSYNCVEFSYDLISDFRKENIYSCITEIVFYDGYAHANVVVNTSDRGFVYIEPQDDVIIHDLESEDDYCDKVDWNCNWKIKRVKTCFDFKDGEYLKW